MLRKLDETLAALEPWRREWFDELRAQLPAPTVDAAANGSTGQEDEADRRQASKTMVVGGLTAALFSREAVERITHHGNRPVDSKLITAHEDIANTLARLHREIRSDALVAQVAQQAEALLELLDRSMPSRTASGWRRSRWGHTSRPACWPLTSVTVAELAATSPWPEV